MRDLNQDLSATTRLTLGGRRLFLLLIGGGALVGAAAYVRSIAPSDSLQHLIGTFGIWFFGLCVIVIIAQIIWPVGSMTLSPEGLTCRIAFLTMGPIPWNAIRGVRAQSTGAPGPAASVVLLDVPDRYKYVSGNSKISRSEARGHQARADRPLPIMASMIGVEAKDLAAAIQARIDAFGSKDASSVEQGDT